MASSLRIVAPPALTDRGRARPVNQDSAITRTFEHARETWTLLVVADGLGGGVDGDIASDKTTRVMADDVSAEGWTDPESVLSRAVGRANQEIFDLGMGATLGPQRMVGTTVVAALIHQSTGRYWTLNVGDSRAYLYNGTAVRQITEDHSLVAERVRAGEISAEEARVAKDRNVVTRAVGSEEILAFDIVERAPLKPGEVILLCSDGLHGMLSDGEIAAVLRGERLEMLPPMLIRAANDAGGLDNIAVAVAGAVGGGGETTGAVREASTPASKKHTPGTDEPRNAHGLLAVAGIALIAGTVAVVAVVLRV